MANWVRVADAQKMIENTNIYVRYNQYRARNSVHLKSFKKEDNKLYIDLDYYKAIEKREKELKTRAMEIYYKLLDVYKCDYAICRALESYTGTKWSVFYSLLRVALFKNKVLSLNTRMSRALEPFVKAGNEMLGVGI